MDVDELTQAVGPRKDDGGSSISWAASLDSTVPDAVAEIRILTVASSVALGTAKDGLCDTPHVGDTYLLRGYQ